MEHQYEPDLLRIELEFLHQSLVQNASLLTWALVSYHHHPKVATLRFQKRPLKKWARRPLINRTLVRNTLVRVIPQHNSRPADEIIGPRDPYPIDDDDDLAIAGNANIAEPQPTADAVGDTEPDHAPEPDTKPGAEEANGKHSESKRESKGGLRVEIAEERKEARERRHKSRNHTRSKAPDEDAVMVDEPREEPPIRRSNTTSTPRSQGFRGLFGTFRKSSAGRDDRSRSRYRDDSRKQADSDVDTARRQRREERRKRRVDTDGEGATTDAGHGTEVDEEAKRAERRAQRRAAREEAQQAEAREAENREQELRARRRRAREERDRQAQEYEERRKRHEEKRARRAAQIEERCVREEEEARRAEAEARAARRDRRRQREAEQAAAAAEAEAKYRRRSSRHPSPERVAEQPRRRTMDDDAKTRRRKSIANERTDRTLQQPKETPYPTITNNKENKIKSWVNSQILDPPEAPPVVGTVLDIPENAAADPPAETPSSDEEARRAIRRKQRRQAKYHHLSDAEIEELRVRRRYEREQQLRSSEGSGDNPHDHYDRHERTSKRTSWFKKITNL